ncbi:MAG: hypothetical protein QOJ00_2273 [Actinomycetota bacterium]
MTVRVQRLGARLVAALGLAAGVLLVGGAPSQAADVTSGWWWKLNMGDTTAFPAPVPNQPLPTTAPEPPTPPTSDGGLLVGATPDGALAIAAVRTSEAATSITLHVADHGDVGGAVAHLAACVATSPWTPAAGGRWDNKPIVACDLANGGGSVAGIPSADGTTWTFPVAPLARDRGTDVVIVPTEDPMVPGFTDPFQITFVAPTARDIVFAPLQPASGSEVVSPDAGDVTDLGGLTADGSGLALVPSLAGGGDFGVPVVSPALAATDQHAPLAIRPVTAVPASDGGQELAGALVVLASLALFYASSRQAIPPRRGLVDVGIVRPVAVTAELGGVGRFARAREGSPPALF